MTEDSRHPQDLDALEDDIRASRARLGGTVEALRDRTARLRGGLARWTPHSPMEHTMKHTYTPATPDTTSQYRNDRSDSARTVRYQGSQPSGSVLGAVTSNPIPLALVGIGLGWLALSGTGYDRRIARSRAVRSARHTMNDAVDYARESLGSTTDSVRNAASEAYDRASGAVGDAYDRASDSVGNAYDRASSSVGGMVGRSAGDQGEGIGHRGAHLQGGRSASGGMSRLSAMTPSADHLRHRMHDVSSGFWDMVEDHPIVAGAMGLALGAAIGAALPSTRYENRWVGDYADEATERAKALAMDALDRGTRAAQAAAQTVVESAKEDVRDVMSAATDAAREEVKKPG